MTTNGRVVQLPVAPRGGGATANVDDALDALVATVDHLVRDLETDRVQGPVAVREAGLPTHEWLALASRLLPPARPGKTLVVRRALLVAALVAVVAIEVVLIAYVVAHV